MRVYISLSVIRSQKKQKLSGQQDFSHKNFPDKACKLLCWQFCDKCALNLKLSNCCGKLLYCHTNRNCKNIQVLDSSFWIIRTVSGLSGQFLNRPDSFRIVRRVSGLSGQFLDYPDSFWIVWTVSGLSGQFLDCLDSFWIGPIFTLLQKLFIKSDFF